MADPQRTHKASPKRVKDFRERGDIALSRDLVSTATLVGAVIGLIAFAGAGANAIVELMRNAAIATDGRETSGLAREAMHTFIVASGPVLVGASIAALIAILMQLGWPPAFKMPGFSLGKLNPISNLKNTYSLGAMVKRTLSSIAKTGVIGAIVALALSSQITSTAIAPQGIAELAWGAVTKSLWFVVGALGAIAAVDYILARRKNTQQMMMTSEEIKREHKESEGDPMIKGRRRQRARELAKRRLAVNVPTADVILVNPTHYAVALRYDEKQDRAPMVVAKGIDEVAQKIRELARKHGIPVLARPPLARALHKHVKEGRQVPQNLYKAVAEVLAFVYRIRQPRP